MRRGSERPAPGKMPLKSKKQRCSPHVASHLPPRAPPGESQPVQRPLKEQPGPPFSHSSPQSPTRLGVGCAGSTFLK